jgi:lipopolysaccharide biosynthesis glycosyltransferase
MVHCLAASIRAFGGRFRDARIVVSVGEDCESFDIDAARPELAPYEITWRWVDSAAFRKDSYFAQVQDRWAEPFDCDYVLMADADILMLGPLEDAVDYIEDNKTIAGVIATYPPFLARDSGDDRVRWPELFAKAGLGPPDFQFPIPGYGAFYSHEGMALAPPYYNFGFVLGARDAMNAIRATAEHDYRIAEEYMRTDLRAQAGLCLSIVRNQLKARALPVRYNFWCHPLYFQHFPDEAAEAHVAHYLNGPFVKHRDNNSMADIERWLSENRNSTDVVTQFLVAALEKVTNAARTQGAR